MAAANDSLQNIIAGVVEPMGFELVGVEFNSGSTHAGTLRVYIDHEDGIVVEDCSRISHQLSAVLDVEEPISGAYTLEVSSPGLDRLLFKAQDFVRFAGHQVNVKLRDKIDGRRRYKGLLQGVDKDLVLVDVDGERWELPLELIEQARLVPEF